MPFQLRLTWLALAATCSLSAATITVDFESLADSDSITNQFPGITFSGATAAASGLSLNELEYPPKSGSVVVLSATGLMTISFGSPVLSFSGFFTYAGLLTLDAFDSLNQPAGSANSAFSANFVSSGNAPNELIQVAFAGGISSVSISSARGATFVLDDVTVETPAGAAIPEPSSWALVFGGLAALAARRSGRR